MPWQRSDASLCYIWMERAKSEDRSKKPAHTAHRVFAVPGIYKKVCIDFLNCQETTVMLSPRKPLFIDILLPGFLYFGKFIERKVHLRRIFSPVVSLCSSRITQIVSFKRGISLIFRKVSWSTQSRHFSGILGSGGSGNFFISIQISSLCSSFAPHTRV